MRKAIAFCSRTGCTKGSEKIAMHLFFKMNSRAADSDCKTAEILKSMGDGFDGTCREHLDPVLGSIRYLMQR